MYFIMEDNASGAETGPPSHAREIELIPFFSGDISFSSAMKVADKILGA
jgi:hypothetical protein